MNLANNVNTQVRSDSIPMQFQKERIQKGVKVEGKGGLMLQLRDDWFNKLLLALQHI